MNNNRLVALTACLILATVPGISSLILADIASETDTKGEQHFEKANELRKAGDYDAAITEYKKAISLSPKSKIGQDAQYWIGQSYFEARQFDAALSAFQKLLDEHPASTIAPSTKQMIERVQQARKNKSLFEAVKKADVEQVKLLIAEGADIDAKWVDVYNKNEEDPWSSDSEKTALRHAVKTGNIEVVKLLVEAGADVNAGEWTPLFQAVDENNTAIAEYLIDHGANVNIEYPQGWTILNQTVNISNSSEMAELLIVRGADINGGDWPLLRTAIRHNRRDLFDLLVQRGVDVNAADKGGWTPLWYAANFQDDTEFMNILIAKGAELNI
ncbi:MAG: ankyrin repeat domain-containing protein, partial [Planctomycetota bacterium]|nr:ankyrin repeat domain-containing protein [Planctomycetota bacterium]